MNHGAKKKFVLAQSANTPAAEVVQRAQAQGIALSTAYVYVLRSQNRGASTQRGATTQRSARQDPAQSLQQSLGASALEIGFARAEQLLTQLRARTSQLR